jgi:hypothetical protein
VPLGTNRDQEGTSLTRRSPRNMIFLMFLVLWLRSKFGENVDLVSGYNYKRGLYLTIPYIYHITIIIIYCSIST